MNRIILTSYLLIIGLTAYCQETIDTYEMLYFDKEYNIQADEPKGNGDFSFYIQVYSLDSKVSKTSLIVKKKNVNDLKSLIEKAKNTYSDWTKTANENQVLELDKEIKLNKLKLSVAFLYVSEWQFDNVVNLKARFRIIDGKHLLILENKYTLQSSSNQFMKSDGFYLVFSSVDEIDNFLSKITTQNVLQHYSKKNSKTDLFKQN